MHCCLKKKEKMCSWNRITFHMTCAQMTATTNLVSLTVTYTNTQPTNTENHAVNRLDVDSSSQRNELPHDKTNKMVGAPSEDIDQPGQCAQWAAKDPTAKTLIRLGRCPGWSESSLGAPTILLVLSWGSSNQKFSSLAQIFIHCIFNKMHKFCTSPPI